MEKNKIRLIIIAVVIVLIYAGLLFIGSRKATKEDRELATQDVLLISSGYMYVKDSGVWTIPTDEEYSNLLTKKEYQVYSENKYLGTHKISYKSYYFYYYDENSDEHRVEYPSLFYASKNNTMELYEFTSTDLDSKDDEIIRKQLDSSVYIPKTEYDYFTRNKVVFDYDNDGTKESLIFVSTGYSDDFLDSKNVFRMVLYVDGTDVQVLFKDVAERGTDAADFYEYTLMDIYKFSNQDKDTIVLSRYIPMGLSYCPTIFEFNGNLLEEKITCKEVQ